MKNIASGIAFTLIFALAACVDGIADAYGMRTLMIVGAAVLAVAGLCIVYSNLPDGGRG
jgi:MFS family permease